MKEGKLENTFDSFLQRNKTLILIFFPFFKDFIYLILERGIEGEREGEKHQCVVAS